jgi:hypothetical protein
MSIYNDREYVMRAMLIAGLFVFSAAVHASSTLRVGSHVLTAGDSMERVTELLGSPSSKTHRSSHSGSRRRGRGTRVISRDDQSGEQWRYRRGDHVTVVTIVDGQVTDIEDHRL